MIGIGVRAAGLAGVMVAIALLLADSANASATAHQLARAAVNVTIDHFSFRPATLSVAVGTTVTWINRDGIPHTAVSTDKVFRSKVLDSNEQFSYTFAKPGTFPYFCSIHPKMTGTIVVR
jgi:plastocyanin